MEQTPQAYTMYTKVSSRLGNNIHPSVECSYKCAEGLRQRTKDKISKYTVHSAPAILCGAQDRFQSGSVASTNNNTGNQYDNVNSKTWSYSRVSWTKNEGDKLGSTSFNNMKQQNHENGRANIETEYVECAKNQESQF